MGKGYRQGRLGGEIRRIISEMLVHGIKDPRLSSMLSISNVDVTRDGSYARVYVTILDLSKDPKEKEQTELEVLEGLYSAKGLIKREISHQIKLHHMPELLFEIDNSMEYGRHITEIIDSLGIENYQQDEEQEEDF
ncbi:MAG: 30S ribosome-binding factor RbfA [Clostridia bacterium]|nr:30S ribosome-binding factor RbfA [Clostridia bacterium]